MSNVTKSPVARSVPFDNTETMWLLDNDSTQEAIEFARSNAIASVRFSIICVFNGQVNNNQWLGYSDNLPGDVTPIVLARNCLLKEISTSFGGLNVDGRIDLYKNGILAGDIIDNTTFTFTNENIYKVFTGLNIPFNIGDQLRGRWVDNGDNPNDMAIVYYFEVVI